MTKVYDTATDLITFARSSTAAYLDSSGVIQSAAVDTPRIEYGSDGSLKGLLIEEQRTNLVANSQLGGAVVGVVGSGGALPTGWSSVAFNTVEVMEIDTFQGVPRIRIKATCDNTGGGGPIYPRIEIGSYSPSASTTYNYSAWVMDGPDRSSIEADLLVPDGVSNFLNVDCSGATEMTQFSGSATTAAGATGTHTIRVAHTVLAGDVGVSDFYISMPQLEEGSFATSYIPTSGSQQTRSADLASIPVTAFGYNQEAGTVVVEFDMQPTDGTNFPRVWSLNSSAVSNTVELIGDTGNDIRAYNYNGTTAVWNADILNDAALLPSIRAALAFTNGDGAATINGGNVITSSATEVVAFDLLTLGGNRAGVQHLNGHIKSIQYYPRRLTNAQLQELTA